MRISKKHSGFTLVETIISMGIISVISVASVYLLFLSLNLRDLVGATVKTEESLRVFSRILHESVIGAVSISGSGNSIFLRSQNECLSFVYDSNLKNLKYSRIILAGCTPDPNPSALFFPSSTKINTMSFVVTNLTTGGRQVNANGLIKTTLPFDTYETTFSISYVNLVD